ncbi:MULTISPECIES: OsmC family protein [Enterobacterales]|uniref:OsmC family protein n=1 Tax=Enterobacterales TaxID=91347 RepID=UPI000847EEC2|nr:MULTISPECIES: OsmC family protein [Enterobacterales]WOO49651.1 OsmC family protein [Hafnia alvei]ODQ03894.1 peroxiredoxin [Shigella sp. FC130]OEI91579.1 peroxiredoxin [Shigella sp. FC1655]OEJ06755.1 peroxiredoxin [Shigella sp. FC1967]WPF04115.1 OsmC family protein [Proteus vulgaris]
MPITEFSSIITSGKQGGLQMQCASRQFQILLDEPLSLGGKDSAMNPVEALLGTLGACKGIVAKSFANMHKINLNDLRIEVNGELDIDGFTGKNKNAKIGFSKITTKFFIDADNNDEEIAAFIAFIERTCPIADTIKNAPILETSYHHSVKNIEA